MDIPGRPTPFFQRETEEELIWGRGEVRGRAGEHGKRRNCSRDAMHERRLEAIKI